jgi:histidinol phosphatase-like enzyme (inositol monophosphatase family)
MSQADSLLPFLDRLADTASDSIMPHFRARPDVENKAVAGFDPVTVADRAAEAAMRRLITEAYPDHGIIGEEFGNERDDAEYVWVLDPIDGTRAFITGLPVWGTLIGLTHRGEPMLGMMAQPFTGERYAGNGQAAWCTRSGRTETLDTRTCSSLAGATLFTTTPALFKGTDRHAYDRVESAVQLARYGCDCYAYCMVAAGHADIVIEPDLKPYDIVALIPIITGAGGHVTDWQGGSAAAGGNIVATGDPGLHDQVLARLAGA